MISNISLRQFRSYLNQSFEFNDGVNIIVGPNGSGKTNLLEAIYLIATNKTFKTVTTKDLQMLGQNGFKISSIDNKDITRSVRVTTQDNKYTKKYHINTVIYHRLPFDKTLPVVIFEPSQLSLLTSGPEKRRKYFDDLIEKTTPGYDLVRNRYIRTLNQRNILLKKPNPDKNEIFAWDIKLTDLAGTIVSSRIKTINNINNSINDIYNKISAIKPKYDIKLNYHSQWENTEYGSEMLKYLQKSLTNDILFGHTQVGPHKDDIKVYFNNTDSAAIASRGENRTIILALKIFELNILENTRQIKPILLLDDVFSELDGKRRKHLTETISSHQTFITTTDADLVINNFSKNKIIPIKPNSR